MLYEMSLYKSYNDYTLLGLTAHGLRSPVLEISKPQEKPLGGDIENTW